MVMHSKQEDTDNLYQVAVLHRSGKPMELHLINSKKVHGNMAKYTAKTEHDFP
jgi:hypothetical protein